MKTGDDQTSSHASGGMVSQANVPAGVLELDRVYTALSHPRRRYLCYTLLEERRWRLRQLATKTAAWESDVTEAAVADAHRERVYVSLFHAHVPKLADLDVIEFDRPTETISAGDHAEQVLNALEGMGASLDTSEERHARGELDG